MNRSGMRAGFGYDLHRLEAGRPLILGGVEIPFERGLVGHSDSDVLSHAICDALLGAVALGDLGTHFPDSDPNFAGASSLALLGDVVQLIAAAGYSVANVDSVVVAEAPRLAPYLPEMRARLAETLGIEIERVSVKAKTNEGVDATGRGEAMAAWAVALVADGE